MDNTHSLDVNNDVVPRTHKINLSVYQYPYSWKTWYGFWRNIKAWFDNKRAAKQRAKRGFCYGDVWDCGDYIVDLMTAILIEYRNKTYGYPGTEEFPTFESWIEFLDKIIDWLEYARKDSDELSYWHKYYQDFATKPASEWTLAEQGIFQSYMQEVNEIQEKQDEARQKAFSNIAPYIPQIWW